MKKQGILKSAGKGGAKKRVRRMRVKHADGLKHGGKRY
jgi:hypothetical protein